MNEVVKVNVNGNLSQRLRNDIPNMEEAQEKWMMTELDQQNQNT